MSHDNQDVPYQRLIDHFDRPLKMPTEHFDPDDLPEGEPRELYDTIMAEYYTHIPAFTAQSAKDKSKFDLVTRTRENSDILAAEAQKANSRVPEVLETVETKQLTRKEIKKIVRAYRNLRPVKPPSTHP
jgi:hypothetical protein